MTDIRVALAAAPANQESGHFLNIQPGPTLHIFLAGFRSASAIY